jgi:hypothetical protein
MTDASGAVKGGRLRVPGMLSRLSLAAEKNMVCEASPRPGREIAPLERLDQSEAARLRALAGREHVLALHSADRLVRDVDALYRELRAARKAA